VGRDSQPQRAGLPYPNHNATPILYFFFSHLTRENAVFCGLFLGKRGKLGKSPAVAATAAQRLRHLTAGEAIIKGAGAGKGENFVQRLPEQIAQRDVPLMV
jgi:hypothetical protein